MTLTPSDHIDIGNRLAQLHHVLIRLRARLGQRYPYKDTLIRVLDKTTNALTSLRGELNNDAQRHYQETTGATVNWYFGPTDLPDDWPKLPDQPVEPRRPKRRMTPIERDFVRSLLRTRINDFKALDGKIRLHYERDSHIDAAALKCDAFLTKLAEAIDVAEVR